MNAVPPQPLCRRCRFPGPDVRLQGCGCHLHTRCLPMSLIFNVGGNNSNWQAPHFGPFPPVNAAAQTQCPICVQGVVTKIVMEPLRFEAVERAVQVRQKESSAGNGNIESASSSTSGDSSSGKKHGRDDDHTSQDVVQVESSYLLLSSSSRSCVSNSCLAREQQRTGRWTNEEIKFVDHVVAGFDNGALPLPHGIKLNEFLGDMLLCKSSRLTKKMKNAKLSSRSFELNAGASMMTTPADIELLSTLQEKFLSSVPTESSQLELRFNLENQWRTNFYNLCVQVGYPNLDADEWLRSVDELGQRANAAEENMRRVRRRKMSMALQTDGGSSANPNVFIGGVKADNVVSQLPTDSVESQSGPPKIVDEKARKISTSEYDGDQSLREDDFNDLAAILNTGVASMSPMPPARGRSRTLSNVDIILGNQRSRGLSDDFDAVLTTLMNDDDGVDTADASGPGGTAETKWTDSRQASRTESPHACGPFLDAIIHYMETFNLPFQHADLWVPSFSPREGSGVLSKAVDTERLRLYHAGHASRGDLDDDTAYKLHEFGVYSDNFSFEPGHGLPGRVYATGKISWEQGVQNKDPKIFERAGGAKVYGIKTAVGFPLDTPLVGRIVVAMYSCEMVPENTKVAQDCAAELVKYSPQPQWKLVLDTGLTIDEDQATTDNDAYQQLSSDMSNPQYGLASPVMYTAEPHVEPPTSFAGKCTPPWNNTSLVEQTGPPIGSVTPTSDQDEKELVSLLGQNMPMSDNSSTNHNLSDFMSLRLLLLRAPGKRSTEEFELIEILKSSYKSYAKNGNRSSKNLADLIVKDWICLKATYGMRSPVSSCQSPPGPLPQPLSHPVARRLSSMEPPQRRHSAGSLPPAFQVINESPNLQPVQQTQVYPTMSMSPAGMFQLKPLLGSNQSHIAPPGVQHQMTHVNYTMPQSSSFFNYPPRSISNSSLSLQSPANASVMLCSTNVSTNNINCFPQTSALPLQYHPMPTPFSDQQYGNESVVFHNTD